MNKAIIFAGVLAAVSAFGQTEQQYADQSHQEWLFRQEIAQALASVAHVSFSVSDHHASVTYWTAYVNPKEKEAFARSLAARGLEYFPKSAFFEASVTDLRGTTEARLER
jgi:hypothetical protein